MSGKGFMIFVIIIVSLHFINQFNAKRKTRERAMVSTVKNHDSMGPRTFGHRREKTNKPGMKKRFRKFLTEENLS